MNRDAIIADLTQKGCFVVDGKVIDSIVRNEPSVCQTRIAIREALNQLEAQGFITFVPEQNWPEYLECKP